MPLKNTTPNVCLHCIHQTMAINTRYTLRTYRFTRSNASWIVGGCMQILCTLAVGSVWDAAAAAAQLFILISVRTTGMGELAYMDSCTSLFNSNSTLLKCIRYIHLVCHVIASNSLRVLGHGYGLMLVYAFWMHTHTELEN